ncbi:dihydrodipicolinate synthase family protein [Niastella koreensis]|uniref:Dihydrodipicolinate synthetase n=2 Tax=Niastella koreensis TaxID=354356 RepID=G8T755_NIAKG|nr:dihydrodipicolinate synthase family protein [Niastella koreensis]AEW00080.1 dihydrodipicolinate synthetase [Niastella koreensis GR20-10]OQP49611.1 dihydrodipicolinate synthase family protein [Niastella koreensis]
MQLNSSIKKILSTGAFIPAHPLALTKDLKLDTARQKGLTNYYLNAGVDGVAVAVHTTQFEIREKQHALLEPVLALAAETIDKAGKKQDAFIKVAGICGPTAQAVKEAELAVKYGYQLGLVSNGGLNNWTNEQLLERIKAIAEVIPVFGFYLQPAVGGRLLDLDFWRAFAEIPNVEAIKVASFNRYQTLDVVKAVCESSRAQQIDLYTGNDDNIITDLLTTYKIPVGSTIVEKRFVGGLLGHWSVWTAPAVRYFRDILAYHQNNSGSLEQLLALNVNVTDLNQALFDPEHGFKGSIAGIHEVLRREGLMDGLWCLNPNEVLSAGQAEALSRVIKSYPALTSLS